MSLKPRVFGLASVSLVLATGTFFAIGSLNSRQAAGSSNPTPKANVLAASLSLTHASDTPNQTIAIIGSGFTPASTAGGG